MSEFPLALLAAIPTLATVDAVLNASAAVLLVTGFVLIKCRRTEAHKWTMLAAFAVSIAFLACYLTYHFTHGTTTFAGVGAVWGLYIAILISHVTLAMAVPFLALWTIYLGLKDYRSRHVRWVWWTFPIWLYVSVTGVIVYLMLYHLYPAS